MKKLKNSTAKKYLVSCTIISIIFITLLGVILKIQNKRYIDIINIKITEILGEIKSKFPDLDEGDIIEILNSSENAIEGKELLEKYGITEEISAIKQIENEESKYNLIIIGIFSLISITLIVLFLTYLMHRKKQIDRLDKYLQRIARREYLLDIAESSEDELNALKNSLYKITVVLKEEAENKNEQNKAILTTVSDISHQLKTFLTSMQIILDNLLESKDMDETTRERFILEASKQIKGVNFLILSLLKLSKLDAKVVEFENETINLEKMIDEILKNLEVLIELKQVNIVTEIETGAEIIGDYNWNKEAIQNIVKNAIEHTKEGKQIFIKISKNDVYTSISIRDEGEGIEEEDLKHIFERFYKAKGSSEDSFGIGLSLSKSIVEKQNGYIEVESRLGEGTTFTIKYLK